MTLFFFYDKCFFVVLCQASVVNMVHLFNFTSKIQFKKKKSTFKEDNR